MQILRKLKSRPKNRSIYTYIHKTKIELTEGICYGFFHAETNQSTKNFYYYYIHSQALT
jgi:hypothetical protein